MGQNADGENPDGIGIGECALRVGIDSLVVVGCWTPWSRRVAAAAGALISVGP